ncbi:reverse transcriptase [Cucumis melo var. makuwa]|uniref:Reverse transcriptase n=1 Tax=Cucumis melo var. makuwa TaxID=1194695 RepID=A0A5A7U890_CUCMM|nr:reverse transcriptase [Cucumis melo var. makuwa]TYK04582.1 reverse transcriptase [Cucumis melo var. makuwa]
MVSKQRNNETRDKSLEKTQTKTEATAVDITMEKLLQRIQTPPIYPMGQPLPPSTQPSGQKQPHKPLSGAWAHYRRPLISLSTPFDSTCRHLSNHLTLQVIRRCTRRPSLPDSNLQNCQVYTAMQIYPSTLYSNLSSVGTRLTNSITDWGLKQASHRHPPVMDSQMFVVSELTKPTGELFLKLVHPSARSWTHDNEKNNGKPILVSEHCKKQWHTKNRCWKLYGQPPREATEHLTGFSEHFVSYTAVLDLSSERTINTVRHSRGLYILDDDTSGSSISRTSLLSSYFSTSEHDFTGNLIKEVGSPTSQPSTPIQDSEPPRDQMVMNETKFRTETSNNETEQGHTRKINKCDPSHDLPIALRKECPEWKNVIMEEMKALEKNNTWEICALPKRHKPVGCKWVFTLKYKVNGTLDGHKARVLFVAVNKDRSLYQLDVKNAFLNGDLVEEVYMSPPPGFEAQFGQQVAKSKEGISVSQRKYTLDLLTETGMLGCRPANTPIELNCKLGNSDDQSVYAGSLKGTHESCQKNSEILKNDTCKVLWPGGNAEAEYRAMSLGICKEIWLQKVLSDLHQECKTPFKLFCNNKAAISIAKNAVQHDRTKHVEIDRHFIKERLDSRSIGIPYIPSSQQVADVLTKGLLKPNFNFCVSKLGLINIYVPT